MKKAILKFTEAKDNVNYKVSQGIVRASMVLPALLIGFYNNFVTAHAKDWDFLENPSKSAKGSDAFAELDKTVQGAGSSMYSVVRNCSIVALAIGIMIIGVGLAINKNATQRSENKTQLLYVIGGAIVVFGAFTFLGISQKIAKGIE